MVDDGVACTPLSFAVCGCMEAGWNYRPLEGEQMEHKSLVERVARFHLTPSDARVHVHHLAQPTRTRTHTRNQLLGARGEEGG